MAIIERRSPTGDASATWYANRAQTLRALGRYEESLAAFERMLRLARKDNNPSFTVYALAGDRKSTRLNSSHLGISYAVFCLKKKTIQTKQNSRSARSQDPQGRKRGQLSPTDGIAGGSRTVIVGAIKEAGPSTTPD